MKTLRITGCINGFMKVHHTKYLKEHLGLGLKEAKTITDDVLDGTVRDVLVVDGQAEHHAAELRALGALVDVVENQAAVAAK